MSGERHVIVEDETLAAGFTQIPNGVLRRPDLQPGAKLTYMVLLSYAWQEDSCYPGQDRLAADMGVSERSVVTYLKQLQEAGLVTVRRRGLGLTNVYVLHRISGSEKSAPPRGARSAPAQVHVPTALEVQKLRPKKTQTEKDPRDEDGSNASNNPPLVMSREDAERIGWVIQDVARELNDRAPLKATTARALKLYTAAGLDLDGFLDIVQAARVRTQRYTGSIKAEPVARADGWPVKPKVAYFFGVLEDMLGVRGEEGASARS